MIRALTILCACLAVGEIVVYCSGIRLPASIIGLLVLFFLLHRGWVQADWFKPVTDFLMQNLMLMLIVPCVALINYLELLAQDAWAIMTAAAGSSICVLLTTAKTHEWLRQKSNKPAEDNGE